MCSELVLFICIWLHSVTSIVLYFNISPNVEQFSILLLCSLLSELKVGNSDCNSTYLNYHSWLVRPGTQDTFTSLYKITLYARLIGSSSNTPNNQPWTFNTEWLNQSLVELLMLTQLHNSAKLFRIVFFTPVPKVLEIGCKPVLLHPQPNPAPTQ